MSNAEISFRLQNNTSCFQPVTLFGNTFNIPNNINQPTVAGRTFSYDISTESFYFGSTPQNLEVQFSTTPAPPFTISAIPLLPTLDANGVASALSSIAGDTFTASGNTITGTSATNYYGNLSVSPSIIATTTSTLSNSYNILEVYADSVLVYSIASNTGTVTAPVRSISNGAIIDVYFSSALAAVSWAVTINQYNDTFSPPTVIYSNSGSGGFAIGLIATFPQSGTIEILASSI